jgi:8-hydroxy-5-deazaflavin:NADPH oxidoreductase
VFNNITFRHLLSLARPAGAADRSALPIAGHDAAATAAVTRFLDEIGYDAVDAGRLGSGGRRFQFGSRAFVTPYGGFARAGYPGRRRSNGGLREPGIPADVAAIRATTGVWRNWERRGLNSVRQIADQLIGANG